ncbi:MAG TPA: hypothetical protein VGQ09_04725 [Chitinophagaceae bacterium]|jgi:hypothetical protein|nr:hypothetical protein [Chitinophagaceae bacterium]
MKKTILFFGLGICLISTKAQDTIWLKSGKTLAGQIFSFADNNVKIKTGNDTFIYKLEEIKSLRYNGPAGKATDATPVYAEDKKRKKEIASKPVKIKQ